MPVIGDAGRVIADAWVSVADDVPLPAGQPAIVSLSRLLAGTDTHAPSLGVRLPPATELETIAGLLDRLALIAIEFPIFRDGRGFTHARVLREHYGYKGEIRAVGHMLPDQYVALLRCGVTSVELPEGSDLAPWAKALTLRGPEAVPLLRRIAPALQG